MDGDIIEGGFQRSGSNSAEVTLVEGETTHGSGVVSKGPELNLKENFWFLDF